MSELSVQKVTGVVNINVQEPVSFSNTLSINANTSNVAFAVTQSGSGNGFVVTANTSRDAFKVTQTGSGNALVIENTASDTTPFTIASNGTISIGETGARLRADMSNATINARFALQTTTANSPSVPLVIPNGNSSFAGWAFANNSTASDCVAGLSYVNGNTTFFSAGRIGTTAPYGPLVLATGDNPRMVIGPTGNVSIGYTDASTPGVFSIYSGSATTITGANLGFRYNTGSASVDMGHLSSGAAWIQNRNITNFSTTYNLLLQPSGGNIGVGVASPTYGTFEIGTNNDASYSVIRNSAGYMLLKVRSDGSNPAGLYDNDGYGKMGLVTGGANRLVIDTSGNALFSGLTSNPGQEYSVGNGAWIEAAGVAHFNYSSGNYWCINARISGSNNRWIGFHGSGSLLGDIYWNGSSVVYSGSSDERAKSNITPYTNAITKIKAIDVVNYTWTESGVKGVGYIAQQLHSVIENVVTPGDDNSNLKPGDEGFEMWQVDKQGMVPYLHAALKEAIAKIETLEAKVAALENA